MYHHIPEHRIISEIIAIEEKHRLKVTRMKVAVLYAKPYQTDLIEIFNNVLMLIVFNSGLGWIPWGKIFELKD